MPINRKMGVTFQGKPCALGHDGLRYVSGKNCVECARVYSKERRKRTSAPTLNDLFSSPLPSPLPAPAPSVKPRLVKGRCQSGSSEAMRTAGKKLRGG